MLTKQSITISHIISANYKPSVIRLFFRNLFKCNLRFGADGWINVSAATGEDEVLSVATCLKPSAFPVNSDTRQLATCWRTCNQLSKQAIPYLVRLGVLYFPACAVGARLQTGAASAFADAIRCIIGNFLMFMFHFIILAFLFQN